MMCGFHPPYASTKPNVDNKPMQLIKEHTYATQDPILVVAVPTIPSAQAKVVPKKWPVGSTQ